MNEVFGKIVDKIKINRCKMLNSKDLNKVGITNIIGSCFGPVCMINSIPHEVATYKFNTIDEVKEFFNTEDISLVYNMNNSLPLPLNKNTKGKIHTYMVRLYKPAKIQSDSFKDCSAITDCIINTIDENLEKII
jgi:hypothetical protein